VARLHPFGSAHSAPVRPIAGRPSLLATSFARCPFPPPCGVGTLSGGQRGCRVQCVGYCIGFRCRLWTGSLCPSVLMLRYTSEPCSVPFWSMRSPLRVRFVFACCQVTVLETIHITFTLPDSPWQSDTSNPASSRFVPEASHLPIAQNACPGRVDGGRIPRLLRIPTFHNPPHCFARRTPEFDTYVRRVTWLPLGSNLLCGYPPHSQLGKMRIRKSPKRPDYPGFLQICL